MRSRAARFLTVSFVSDLFSVLRHRSFRFLWFAQSIIGEGVVIVALALYVTQLTGDARDVGLVLAAGAIPLVTFTLLGGVWGDRLPRVRVMMATDLVRFAAHITLAALIAFGEPQVWQIAAIEAIYSVAEAFFRPAATGLMPQTVPEAEIQQAAALMTTVSNVAELTGPAMATILVLGVGASAAFALDALTFLASAAFLTQVDARTRGVADVSSARERPSLWDDLRDGFREVRSRAWVWVTLVAFSVALFCALAPEFVLGPSVAREQYGHIGVYGLWAAALGAGTIAGSLVGIRWRPRHPMRMAMILAATWPLAGVLFGAGLPLALVLPATVAAGAAISLFDVWWMTAQGERIPPDRLSRVSSFDWAISIGLLPAGYVLAGPLADAVGAVEVLIAGSLIASLALALSLIPREIRMLERIDHPPGEPSELRDLPRLPNP